MTTTRPLIERRRDAVLTLLRSGKRTAHEIADAIHVVRRHALDYYINALIAEGKAHICEAVRAASGGPFPVAIYAYGPPPEGVERCHTAQYEAARATLLGDDGPRYLDSSLDGILEVLRHADLTTNEIAERVGVCRDRIKDRLDHLIQKRKVHVMEYENRDKRPRFIYSIGPGKGRMPETASGQYMRARKAYRAAQAQEAERRKEALRQPARVDIAAAWFAPQPTKRQEIRA